MGRETSPIFSTADDNQPLYSYQKDIIDGWLMRENHTFWGWENPIELCCFLMIDHGSPLVMMGVS